MAVTSHDGVAALPGPGGPLEEPGAPGPANRLQLALARRKSFSEKEYEENKQSRRPAAQRREEPTALSGAQGCPAQAG